MALGPGAITQLTKLVGGIPKVLRNIPTIASDPVQMFGEIAANKEIAQLEEQTASVRDAAEQYANDRRGDLDQQLASGQISAERHRDKINRLQEPVGQPLSQEQKDAIIDAKVEQLKPTLLPALAPIAAMFGFSTPLLQLVDFLKGSGVNISGPGGGGGGGGGGGPRNGNGNGNGLTPGNGLE